MTIRSRGGREAPAQQAGAPVPQEEPLALPGQVAPVPLEEPPAPPGQAAARAPREEPLAPPGQVALEGLLALPGQAAAPEEPAALRRPSGIRPVGIKAFGSEAEEMKMALKNSWKWLVALGAIFVPASLMAAVTVPNSFTAGTPIVAADMNANFTSIKTFVDGLETTINSKADAPASGKYANTPTGRVAYAWVSDSCSKSTAANCASLSQYQYNPSGAAPTSTRTALGRYTVNFPNLSSANSGNVQVTAWGDTTHSCKVINWEKAAVNVRCHTTAGADVDSAFSALVTR